MTTIRRSQGASPLTELKLTCHTYTDLVEVARHIPATRAGILLCDETHIHVYTAAGTFSVEWVDCEDGPSTGSGRSGTNYEAMAAAIEAKLANQT